MDEELQRDATPATIQLEVKVDPAQQLAGLVAQLTTGTAGQCDQAVSALGRTGKEALPKLRKARTQANGYRRWWIDAAIQEIERSNKQG